MPSMPTVPKQLAGSNATTASGETTVPKTSLPSNTQPSADETQGSAVTTEPKTLENPESPTDPQANAGGQDSGSGVEHNNSLDLPTLLSGKFSIELSVWQIGDEGKSGNLTSKGAILSTSITEGTRVADLKLVDLRMRLAKSNLLSKNRKQQEFCTPTGTAIPDEDMTFREYLEISKEDIKPKSGLPSVNVAYKLALPQNQPVKPDMANIPGSRKEMDLKLSKDLFENEKRAQATTGEARTSLSEGLSFAPSAGSDLKDSVAFLTEVEWNIVLNTCGVMFGWIIDREKHKILPAPRPAFRLKMDVPKLQDVSTKADPLPKERETKSSDDKKDAAATSDQKKEASTQAKKEENLLPKGKVSLPGIPSFRVNDKSHVEITVSSHEFETSMAHNDFSTQSTEGAVSGGYAGFSASISGGHSRSNSKKRSATTNVYKKTMVASYKFPRADIILHPEDLEPTPELASALAKIEKSKNIKDLRQLHQDFGHVFCKHITVGGRLQSTKVMEDTRVKTEQEQKEQYKTSIGVQISTPVGIGAGIQRERQTGKSTSGATGTDDRDERNVFEAVGGDTILVSEPNKWIPTVAKFYNWRVINRDVLKPLVDIIAGFPQYSGVKNIFIQAVPKLNTYIELADGHEFKGRLRLVSDQNHLSKWRSTTRLPDPSYYLGHIPNTLVTPRYFKLTKGYTNPTLDILENPADPPIFTPETFRAPTILGYNSDSVSGPSFAYGQEFLNSVWSITAPFTNALEHNCLVTLSTVPLAKDDSAGDPVKFENPPAPATDVIALQVADAKKRADDDYQKAMDALADGEAKLRKWAVEIGRLKEDCPELQELTTTLSSERAKIAERRKARYKEIQETMEVEEAANKPIEFVHIPPSSLVVFRNQQGVFLPGMSTADEYQYWRILKVGATRDGESICESDSVRFSWSIADQTTGFRDFLDDIYGRRRANVSPDLKAKKLYLKLPWPRFDPITYLATDKDPAPGINTMLMDTNETTKDSMTVIVPWAEMADVGRELKYTLQDVTFRIDMVPNNGRGDGDDYLLPNEPEETDDKPKLPPGGKNYREPMAKLADEARKKQDEKIEQVLFTTK